MAASSLQVRQQVRCIAEGIGVGTSEDTAEAPLAVRLLAQLVGWEAAAAEEVALPEAVAEGHTAERSSLSGEFAHFGFIEKTFELLIYFDAFLQKTRYLPASNFSPLNLIK